MGALLIPNKPIYRKTEGEEYYIYFSKDTVLKASQRYLTNGYQGNSTLEHSDNLQGLTLVESWIVEDDKYDKSRKYDMNVPIGTWMGTVKVNNEEVWNDYVKTGKVKGFSIEGFFADKIKASKMNKKMNENKEADLLLSKITSILKGEKVDLSLVDDAKKILNELTDLKNGFGEESRSIISAQSRLSKKIKEVKSKLNPAQKIIDNYESQLKDLGIDKSPPIISNMKKIISEIKKDTSRFEKDFL